MTTTLTKMTPCDSKTLEVACSAFITLVLMKSEWMTLCFCPLFTVSWSMHLIRFTAPNNRPDFRQVAVFLWREGQNYDSEGDSFNPASREWTELYLSNREKDGEWLEIGPDESSATNEDEEVDRDDVLRMSVRSEHLELAARAAFYLATCTGGEVAANEEQEFSPPSSLIPLLGKDFNPSDALERAAKSPFARSSLDHPYPNLEG